MGIFFFFNWCSYKFAYTWKHNPINHQHCVRLVTPKAPNKEIKPRGHEKWNGKKLKKPEIFAIFNSNKKKLYSNGFVCISCVLYFFLCVPKLNFISCKTKKNSLYCESNNFWLFYVDANNLCEFKSYTCKIHQLLNQ